MRLSLSLFGSVLLTSSAFAATTDMSSMYASMMTMTTPVTAPVTTPVTTLMPTVITSGGITPVSGGITSAMEAAMEQAMNAATIAALDQEFSDIRAEMAQLDRDAAAVLADEAAGTTSGSTSGSTTATAAAAAVPAAGISTAEQRLRDAVAAAQRDLADNDAALARLYTMLMRPNSEIERLTTLKYKYLRAGDTAGAADADVSIGYERQLLAEFGAAITARAARRDAARAALQAARDALNQYLEYWMQMSH